MTLNESFNTLIEESMKQIETSLWLNFPLLRGVSWSRILTICQLFIYYSYRTTVLPCACPYHRQILLIRNLIIQGTSHKQMFIYELNSHNNNNFRTFLAVVSLVTSAWIHNNRLTVVRITCKGKFVIHIQDKNRYIIENKKSKRW